MAKMIDRPGNGAAVTASGLGASRPPPTRLKRRPGKSGTRPVAAGTATARARSTGRFPTCRSRPLYGPEDAADLDLARDLAFPASIRTRAASMPTCIATASGRCASLPGSATRNRRTNDIIFCSSKARRALGRLRHADADGLRLRRPQARGEVGKCGVAIDSLADMEVLFDGIDIGEITTSMTINGPACIALAQYVAAAEKQGHPARQARRHDPGRHPQRIHRAERVDLPAASAHAHHRRHDRVLHARDAAVEHDLDLGLSHPRSRIDRGAGTGLHARRRLRVRRSRDRRAAWTSTRSRRGSRSSSTRTSTSSRRSRSSAPRAASTRGTCAKSTAPKIRARGRCASTPRRRAAVRPRSSRRTTSCASRSKRWPPCSAARSRCTRTRWTKCMALPTEKSVEIALRTQQVLAYETNVTNVVDPLGGSYFVEALTDEMERQAEAYFAQIAEFGGVIEAIEAGFFQREIADASAIATSVRSKRRTASSSASTPSRKTSTRSTWICSRSGRRSNAGKPHRCRACAPPRRGRRRRERSSALQTRLRATR